MKYYQITYKFKHDVELDLYDAGIIAFGDIGEKHTARYNGNTAKHAFMKFWNHSKLFYGSLTSRKVLNIEEIVYD